MRYIEGIFSKSSARYCCICTFHLLPCHLSLCYRVSWLLILVLSLIFVLLRLLLSGAIWPINHLSPSYYIIWTAR